VLGARERPSEHARLGPALVEEAADDARLLPDLGAERHRFLMMPERY